MSVLPPVGWADVATKRDLDALEQRMDLRFEAMGPQVRRLGTQAPGAFRGELLTAITGAVTAQTNAITAQTRTLVLANMGAMLSTAALAFGAAKLA